MSAPPTNASPSAILFLSALVCDALSAVDSTSADVPASLRSTCIALTCTFAAPVLRTDAVSGFFQRPVIGVALIAVAIVGVHEGGEQTRLFDALHVAIIGALCIAIFWRGGADESTSPSYNVKINTSIIMLSVGFLVYASVRILRSALMLGKEVSDFEFHSTQHNVGGTVRGIAYANAQHAFAGATTGSLGLACGALVSYRVELLSKGTGELAMALATGGLACLLCFMATLFGMVDDATKLAVIFGASTCLRKEQCEAAFVSRRLLRTLSQPSGTLFVALGLLVLAYPPALRLNSRAAAARWSWTTTGLLVGGFTALITVSFVIPYLETWKGIYFTLLLATAWTSSFIDSFLGSVIAATTFIVLLYNEAQADQFTQFEFKQWSVVVVVTCLLLHALASMVNLYGSSNMMFQSAVWLLAPFARDDVRAIDLALGGTTVLAMSIAMFALIYFGFELAAYDGAWTPRFGSPAEQALNDLIFYLMPAATVLPLYTCRCEVQLLSPQVRALLWVAAPLIPTFLYLITASHAADADPLVNKPPLKLVPVLMSVLPWGSLALV